jgi:uncharacterized protein YybS (DUF2232 family)
LAKTNLLSSNSPFIKLLLIITFFSAASLIPFIGLLFLITLPMVLFVLCLLNDPAKTLFAFLVVLCAMAILLSSIHDVIPVFAMAAMGLAGMVMARTAQKNYSIEIITILPSLILLGAITFYVFYSASQLSISPGQLIEKYFTQAVELNIKFYSRLPVTPEELKAIQDSKPAVIQLFTGIFPALCIISVLFTFWLNTLMANRILYKAGVVLPQLSALCEWRSPGWLVWFFIAGGGLSLLAHTNIHFAGLNVFLVASSTYLLQGLAIVSFFFQHKNIPVFFRWFGYFLIAIQQILMIAIAAMGLFDLWIDFRKYFRKDQATT